MIMTFMCLMMKILKISSPSNSTTEGSKPSHPPYKLAEKSTGKGSSKIPRPKAPSVQFGPRPLGERNEGAGQTTPSKKRFGKLRKIGHKIRKLGGYEKGEFPNVCLFAFVSCGVMQSSVLTH